MYIPTVMVAKVHRHFDMVTAINADKIEYDTAPDKIIATKYCSESEQQLNSMSNSGMNNNGTRLLLASSK